MLPVASALLALSLTLPAPDPAANALLDSAIARMGGRSALEGIERMHIEQMTEWFRTILDDRITDQVLSYERSTEWRDYTKPAWRYSRHFPNGANWQEVIDVVVDSVATIRNNGVEGPQSVAYVDERDEVFATTPERVLLVASRAGNATLLADTTIVGRRYRRIRTTLDKAPATIYIDRATLLPGIVTLHAGQTRDFGLAPWGVMDVEFRFSRWAKQPASGLTLPAQIDVYRVGRPYKRMVWLAVNVNPTIPADSITISDAMRTAFFKSANRAMYDLPLDSARITDKRFATFGVPGMPVGALELGKGWLVFDPGTAPLSMERSAAALARADASSHVDACLTLAESGSGGAVWCAEHNVPIYVAPSAKAYVDASLKGWGKTSATVRSIKPNQWLRFGADSILVTAIDLPDFPASPIVYAPSQQWIYSPVANRPLQRELIVAYGKARGWQIVRVAAPGGSFAGTSP